MRIYNTFVSIRKLFLIAFISGLSLMAQVVDPQYQAWMKSMQPSLMAIRNAPDKAATADAANKLPATFDQVAMYWKAKQTADAVGFAETARDAAKAIAAGSGEKVTNLEKIEQQCGACHQAHRFQRGGDSDPDRAVKGGSLPEGWNVRPDRGTANQINVTLEIGRASC